MVYLKVVACVVVLLIAGSNQSLIAAPLPTESTKVGTDAAQSFDNISFIDANKILMFVSNHGSFGRDLTDMFGQDAGTFYPYLDTASILSGDLDSYLLYAAGLWLGGKVDGEIRIAASEYASEFVPGPMENKTFMPDQPEFKVYKLYRDSLEGNPNADYLNWPAEQGAPVDSAGKPVMLGDQMLWTVYNDADPAKHILDLGSTAPLGIEIRQTVWAEDEPGEIELPIPPDIPITHIGNSSGSIGVKLIDYKLLKNHDYMIIFEADTVHGTTWDLIDLTTDEVLYDNVISQAGDYQDVDGAFQVAVVAPRMGLSGWEIPNGNRRFTWAGGADGFGWEEFGGALGWGGPGDWNGFGSYQPVPGSLLPNVLLKLAPVGSDGTFDPNHEDVSYAYRYLRSAGVPAQPEFGPFIVDPDPPGGSYGFQDFEKSCPLSAWNIDVDPPERLTVGFLENNEINGLVDGKYWPGYYVDYDNTSSTGPREWLWIYLDDYSETPNPAYQLNAIEDSMPVMYWATWARLAEEAWLDEDEFQIFAEQDDKIPVTDTFLFSPIYEPPFTTGEKGLAIYIKYELVNKGGNYIKDFFLSIWSDPDLGGAGDDFAGCDPEDDLFYCYNAGDHDAVYHRMVPAVGFKIIQGPVVHSPGDTGMVDNLMLPNHKNLGLSAFASWCCPGIDPNYPIATYNYMIGLWGNADPYQDHTGDTTVFQLAGDPVEGTGDLDLYPSDRRMFGTVGPINLPPGERQQYLIKMAVGQGVDRLASLTSLRQVLNSEPAPPDPISCCGYYTGGFTGNTDFDSDGKRNLSDLVRLIDRIFLSKQPLRCEPEGNTFADTDSKINLADITRLIDLIYLSKRETAICQ